MNILSRIAKYFMNWDGEDEAVTDIRLSTQDLLQVLIVKGVQPKVNWIAIKHLSNVVSELIMQRLG